MFPAAPALQVDSLLLSHWEAHMNMGGTQFNHRDVEVIYSTLPIQ